MNISASPALRAPCEESPRACCKDSCRYYSVLHSRCRYHELRARQMAVEPSWLADTKYHREEVKV